MTVDHVDHFIRIGDHALFEIVGTVCRPVGLKKDNLPTALHRREIIVKGIDVGLDKGLPATAGAGRSLCADHIDLHLIIGVCQPAAVKTEHGLECGLLVADAAKCAGLPVVVAQGIGLLRVGEGFQLRAVDHVIDLRLPVNRTALAVLDIVAAVGEHPWVLTLVLQFGDHLPESRITADAVMKIRHKYNIDIGAFT